jgi:hypothetical protein
MFTGHRMIPQARARAQTKTMQGLLCRRVRDAEAAIDIISIIGRSTRYYSSCSFAWRLLRSLASFLLASSARRAARFAVSASIYRTTLDDMMILLPGCLRCCFALLLDTYSRADTPDHALRLSHAHVPKPRHAYAAIRSKHSHGLLTSVLRCI